MCGAQKILVLSLKSAGFVLLSLVFQAGTKCSVDDYDENKVIISLSVTKMSISMGVIIMMSIASKHGEGGGRLMNGEIELFGRRSLAANPAYTAEQL